MKEEFLQYVWQFSLFSKDDLQTTKGERIQVVKQGRLNKNSGPDFLEAHVTIDNQKWIGNVEIHLKSSDWYAHYHEKDENYDAVILHVVFEDDVAVFMKNNQVIPTLVLKDRILPSVFDNYNQLFDSSKKWILCENDIATVDKFVFNNWLERLYLERLEVKAVFINELLEANKNDYEAVFFQLLAKNFGLNINGNAFFNLAKVIDFSLIRKEWSSLKSLSALFFGMAGFLEDEVEERYHIDLKSEFDYLKHKYKLTALDKKQFQFFRMRPNNFPTIRLAQLVALYVKHQNLFSKIISIRSVEEYYNLFSVEIDDFWNTHYTFDKKSKKSKKRITKSFVDLLIINTIIPLRFVYLKKKNKDVIVYDLELLKEMSVEKNNIINKFYDCGVKIANVLESQALLQMKNEYCDQKKCLNCSIGNILLNR